MFFLKRIDWKNRLRDLMGCKREGRYFTGDVRFSGVDPPMRDLRVVDSIRTCFPVNINEDLTRYSQHEETLMY